jgi:bifunctional non-homologous end joining protein LigD
MLRYPNGIHAEHFFHKDVPDFFPAWIKRIKVEKADGFLYQAVCQNAATLVYLANYGCLTPHIWLSEYDKLDYPDRLIFDLDPSDHDFGIVKETAYEMKKVLEALDLIPFIMTTGSRGVHVVVPLKRQYEFDWVRGFARDVAHYLVGQHPKELTIETRKAARGKRLFIDTIRNAYAATGVAPYAIRAYPEAPVATPIEWDELKERNFDSRRYTIKTVFKRLKERGDAWKGIDKKTQSLTNAAKKIKTKAAQD